MDRLSVLPDEVIFHIFSFLPPKVVVQTSILSKGWRFHWSRTSFGFTKLANSNWFFWSPFFVLRKKQITNPNKNIFHMRHDTSKHEFESWIVARNISNLVIALNDPLTLPPFLFTIRNLVIALNDPLTLPSFLFATQSLQYLCIVNSYGESIPKGSYLHISPSVYFPALKKLELDNVGFDSIHSLAHLLEGCPLVEELMIKVMIRQCCIIISKTLTALDIYIECSSLVFLKNPIRRHLNSVIEADIDLMNMIVSKYPFRNVSDQQFRFPVTHLVGELYNVKRLTLSTPKLMDVSNPIFDELWRGGNFYNLTQLNLRTDDWRFVTYFLTKSINLQILTINNLDRGNSSWMELEQVPDYLISNLKIVNLVNFRWSKMHEFAMVKSILKNAKVLKRMEIIFTPRFRLDWNLMFEAIKRFATLEIGSRTCELILTLQSTC